jgi:cell division protein FtsX
MRLLRFAFRNIYRSLLLSISSVVVISLMTFLIFIMFLVEYVLQGLAMNVNSRLSLVLHVKSEYSATSKEVIDVLRKVTSISDEIDASFFSSQDNL